jgi:hypothetical protein
MWVLCSKVSLGGTRCADRGGPPPLLTERRRRGKKRATAPRPCAARAPPPRRCRLLESSNSRFQRILVACLGRAVASRSALDMARGELRQEQRPDGRGAQAARPNQRHLQAFGVARRAFRVAPNRTVPSRCRPPPLYDADHLSLPYLSVPGGQEPSSRPHRDLAHCCGGQERHRCVAKRRVMYWVVLEWLFLPDWRARGAPPQLSWGGWAVGAGARSQTPGQALDFPLHATCERRIIIVTRVSRLHHLRRATGPGALPQRCSAQTGPAPRSRAGGASYSAQASTPRSTSSCPIASTSASES